VLHPSLHGAQIDELLSKNHVVLFMKGTRHFPQCGFSASLVGVIAQYVPKFETVNVLAAPELREGIKEYSKWPTIPQLYIGGKFVGGSDIVKEMHDSGELASMLGVSKAAPKEAKAPALTITPGAAAAIKAASKEAGGDPLRVEVSPRFEVDLYFDSKTDADFVVETSGVTVLVAKSGAARAEGVSIDYVQDAGFRVDNPNAPPKVKSMTAAELKRALDAGEKFLLLDVRTDAEIKTAKIAGSRPIDSDVESLPKDAKIVLHCHHGVRSRAAAEELLTLGFKNVFNLEGGIAAYSDVDPSVPRY